MSWIRGRCSYWILDIFYSSVLYLYNSWSLSFYHNFYSILKKKNINQSRTKPLLAIQKFSQEKNLLMTTTPSPSKTTFEHYCTCIPLTLATSTTTSKNQQECSWSLSTYLWCLSKVLHFFWNPNFPFEHFFIYFFQFSLYQDYLIDIFLTPDYYSPEYYILNIVLGQSRKEFLFWDSWVPLRWLYSYLSWAKFLIWSCWAHPYQFNKIFQD